MSKLSLFLFFFLAISSVRSEFLFEKSVAADDSFLCLHKKLYRREKPAAPKNPARILSQMRILQSGQITYPPGMSPDYIPDFNAMLAYLQENLSFTSAPRAANEYCLALYNKGYIDFFKSDNFKIIVRDSAELAFANMKASGITLLVTKSEFANLVGDATSTKINQMMTDYLQQYNINQASTDGIAYNKIVYVMLNILPLFKEDIKTARTAYEDSYSSNKDQVQGTEAINSAAIIRWIESIKTRYAQLKAAPTPDTQQILDPYYDEGFTATDSPAGNYLDSITTPSVPSPTEIAEPEPTPTVPIANQNLLIPDLIIEIQRTYNVHKMLLTYNQLPQSLRSDIDSCKLSLAPALARCEAAFGAGNCEAISGVAVHQKCPNGYLRQGCCKCVVECDSSQYYSSNAAFCQHKADRHAVPAITSPASAAAGSQVVVGLNIAVGSCTAGFSLNKFLCYRACPLGTRSAGGATCLKDQPIILRSPFVWSAGDE